MQAPQINAAHVDAGAVQKLQIDHAQKLKCKRNEGMQTRSKSMVDGTAERLWKRWTELVDKTC